MTIKLEGYGELTCSEDLLNEICLAFMKASEYDIIKGMEVIAKKDVDIADKI